MVADELSISYLWVDAICIIQDDDDDKAVEIAQMPQIYSNAVVTIRASRSAKVGDGFLHERQHSGRNERMFRLPYKCPLTGDMGSVFLLPAILDSMLEMDPLERRAWALQEGVLSSRNLDFGTLQTRWLSRSENGIEVHVDGWRPFKDTRNTLFNQKALEKSYQKLKRWYSGHVIKSDDAIDPWSRLVETYTLRQLTIPQDRLLALSGLATRYVDSNRSDYLAGMWRFSLLLDPAWSAQHELTNHAKDSRVQLSPSWSWASVNYPVKTGPGMWMKPSDFDLQYADCQVDIMQDVARFGALQSGTLTLRGRSRTANLAYQQYTPGVRSNYDFRIYEESAEDPLGFTHHFDAPEDDFVLDRGPKTWTVRLLKVAWCGEGYIAAIKGLILEQTGDQGTYRRVGTVSLTMFIPHDPSIAYTEGERSNKARRGHGLFRWWDDCEEEIVTIV